MTTIDLDDAPAWFDKVGKEVQEAALRGLYMAGLRGVQDIVARIIPSRSPQPVDRGVYRAGWGPASVTKVGAAVILHNREVHAAFIEFGVRAENVKIGRKMIAALAEWGLRKGIVSDQKEAISFAWAVAKKMQRRGIFNRSGKQGLRVLEELIKTRMDGFIKHEVEAAIKRVLE